MKTYCRDTWIEVNLDAIRDNVKEFRSHIPVHSKIMAVVKADGYGHGSVPVGRHALANGANSLAVAMLDEAIVLRKAGITEPILVLGFTPLDSVKKAVTWDVELTAYQLDWITEANHLLEQSTAEKPLCIHIKVDTGMGRLGVSSEEELLELVKQISASKALEWTGVFTHFACADEEDTTHVEQQHEKFTRFLQFVKEKGFELPCVHCNNSAAAIAFPDWSYDTIRLGISLYGLYPSSYLKKSNLIKLTPALSLKTCIAHVKQATEPLTVSYGVTYTAEAGEIIATLPIGYADGYSRLLSNRGVALYRGQRVAVVGRVCMDQIMVRLKDQDAQVGDELVLYGKQGEAEITLDEVALQLGTINYEVACMLNHRIPRLYVKNGEIVDVAHFINKNK